MNHGKELLIQGVKELNLNITEKVNILQNNTYYTI